MGVTIATWNVNSAKARLQHICDWLQESQTDIVLLQEIKCVDDAFPRMEIEELGYNIATHGQKTYNGVAILSKYPMDDVVCGLPTFPSDEEARYIEGVISLDQHAVRVASVYVPNGTAPDSDRFSYKLDFLERLRDHAQTLLTYDEMLVIGGDYNVAPEDHDVYDPKRLHDSICFHPEEQERFRALEHLGLTDVYRRFHPDTQQFSWWDYRGGSWQRNEGMRIDHLLLSPQAADAAVTSNIDLAPRGKEKASDHTPVWVELG